MTHAGPACPLGLIPANGLPWPHDDLTTVTYRSVAIPSILAVLGSGIKVPMRRRPWLCLAAFCVHTLAELSQAPASPVVCNYQAASATPSPEGIEETFAGVAALFGWLEERNISGAACWLESDGCDAHSISSKGPSLGSTAVVAMVPRGGCSFGAKAVTAQRLGASALVVINSDAAPEALFPMGSTDAEAALVSIPVVLTAKGFLEMRVVPGSLPWESCVAGAGSRGLITLQMPAAGRASSSGLSPGAGGVAGGVGPAARVAVAEELSRIGRHDDALLQLETAAAAAPRDPTVRLKQVRARARLLLLAVTPAHDDCLPNPTS